MVRRLNRPGVLSFHMVIMRLRPESCSFCCLFVEGRFDLNDLVELLTFLLITAAANVRIRHFEFFLKIEDNRTRFIRTYIE